MANSNKKWKLTTFLEKMITEKDEVSSKRVIAIAAFMCLCGGFWIALFKKIDVQEFIWNSMLYIVLGGLGLTSLEKFRGIGKGVPTTTVEESVTTTSTPAQSESTTTSTKTTTPNQQLPPGGTPPDDLLDGNENNSGSGSNK